MRIDFSIFLIFCNFNMGIAAAIYSSASVDIELWLQAHNVGNNCFLHKDRLSFMLSSNPLTQGCPTCGPGATCGPLAHFMRPPDPPRKSRRSRKLLLLFADSTLLYLHRWFSVYAYYSIEYSGQGLLALTDLLLTPNQCLRLGLHGRRLCTRYWLPHGV